MTNSTMPTTLQDMREANKIGFHIRTRIFNAIPNASLSSQIDDMTEIMFLKKFKNCFFIGKINFCKLKMLIFVQLRQTILFNLHGIICIEIV